MNERDDYLLDPKAAPDPEVAALERALAPLAWRDVPLREDVLAEPTRMRGRRRRWPLLAAALLLGGVGIVFALRDRGLRPGDASRSFEAKAQARRVPLGDLAEITLRPGSELQFVHWQKDELLFRLTRGGLEARVQPNVKARFFCVDTKVGRVVDFGCRYELVLLEDGRAQVRVTEGAVTFEVGGRSVFVPAGAETTVTAAGASTPFFTAAAAPELRKAVREYDQLLQAGAPIDQRSASVKMVRGAIRSPRDSLVLWHLLRDPEPEFRDSAEKRLFELVGPPDGGKEKRESFDPEEWLPFLRLFAWQGGG